MLFLRGRQRHLFVGERFHKARKDRDRRLQFVRHVGDEVAPHGVELFFQRDIPGQQQYLVVAERDHPHREHGGLATRAPQHQRFGESIRVEVGKEVRVAQQVRDRLPGVALGVDIEMALRGRVRPLDLPFTIQDHDAVRQRLAGGAKPGQCAGHGVFRLVARPEVAVQFRQRGFPGATADRQGFALRGLEPVPERRQVAHVVHDHQQQAGGQQAEGRFRSRHERKGQRCRRKRGQCAKEPGPGSIQSRHPRIRR